ncbi:MAG: class I SAM-dependent methyltransferase [Thermodesulfobacteriota bacterium]|nr:class I SAM-dependent methyltransferase [Thermodesulfobacteriota bacterium]
MESLLIVCNELPCCAWQAGLSQGYRAAHLERGTHRARYDVMVMGYVFGFKEAQGYDDWYENPQNRFVADLENHVMLRLLRPVRGERLLDIGCGTGRGLFKFLEMGLDVTGLDASPQMLEVARKRLGHRVDLRQGSAEDLPFEDSSFNIATLVTSLEFVDDPYKALQEACRVAKDRVFLGVLNRYSVKAIERRVKGMFSQSVYNRARFFSVWELKRRVREILGRTPVRWGTAPQLPASLNKYTQYFEKYFLVQKSPFGTFIGMAVTLVPRYRTKNIPIDEFVRQPTKAAPSLMQTPTHSSHCPSANT